MNYFAVSRYPFPAAAASVHYLYLVAIISHPHPRFPSRKGRGADANENTPIRYFRWEKGMLCIKLSSLLPYRVNCDIYLVSVPVVLWYRFYISSTCTWWSHTVMQQLSFSFIFSGGHLDCFSLDCQSKRYGLHNYQRYYYIKIDKRYHKSFLDILIIGIPEKSLENSRHPQEISENLKR